MAQLRIFGLFTLLVLQAQISTAATVIEGSNKKDTIITLTSEMRGEKNLHVIVRAPNSANSSFSFIADAPTGTSVQLSSLVIGNRVSLESTLSTPGALVAVRIFNNGDFKQSLANRRSQSFRVNRDSADGNAPPPIGERDPTCGCLAQNQIQYYIDFAHRLGLNFSRQDICGYAGTVGAPKSCDEPLPGDSSNPNTPPSSSDGALSGSAYLPSDACNRGAGLAAVLTFDLSKLPEASFDGTHVIQIGTLFKAYDGNRRASVKDKGAGKYKGSLLLAAPVGGYDAGVGSLKYATNGRLTNKQQLKPTDYVYYSGGGGLLYRIPFKPSGDRRSINVNNGLEGYTFCAKMSAVRQFFNGYSN